ncbi:BMC domain-containing protein [Virgibacillus sp. YIM 98842]|uniref:BMC domain-containing protein n=1 Tax=Virgibacillus sp. YIM 98842 TaxID=2663533 RepID=UPI0013DABA62|nr:BMC domain-containing protein [Virgibacillus sp. YIM 98842]
MFMEALGLIENRSYLSSIVAADTALKAADVNLIDVEIIKGGYVTVKLIGDVAAVRAAVDSGTAAVEPFGTLISSHVIPRMHRETHQLIEKLPQQSDQDDPEKLSEQAEPKNQSGEQAEGEKEIVVREEAPEALEKDDVQVDDHAAEDTPDPEQGKKAPVLYRKDLEKMTVSKLRQLARERDVMPANTKNIKYARKAELISSLIDDDGMYDNEVKG